ncbi:hypothetical protein VNO78_05818 [Psophocarpus tetragonolobus]|uniref:Uncharacterized protein n=1 Tax=Psophocarpus tetragonolobus TaxID=3891 RepID=A0AAN9SRM0_PSOTE
MDLQVTLFHTIKGVTEKNRDDLLLEGGRSLSTEEKTKVPKGGLTPSSSLSTIVVVAKVPLAAPAIEAGHSPSPAICGGSSEAFLSYFVPWLRPYVCGDGFTCTGSSTS